MVLFQDPAKVKKEFEKYYLFSQNDLLASFALYIDYINRNEKKRTKKSTDQWLQLCHVFFEKLKKCKIPEVTPWWFYSYDVNNDSITLNLYKTDEEKIELDDEDNISMADMSLESTLFKVECDYVSVQKFSDIQGVKPETVKRWIVSGKLRYAKKLGNEWLISACENKPKRDYGLVNYEIVNPESLNIEEYPTLSSCQTITIFQNDVDKSKYECHFNNYQKGLHQKLILSKKDVESLEYKLLLSGNVRPAGGAQYMPVIER